jgi:hypothetical protein
MPSFRRFRLDAALDLPMGVDAAEEHQRLRQDQARTRSSKTITLWIKNQQVTVKTHHGLRLAELLSLWTVDFRWCVTQNTHTLSPSTAGSLTLL